MLTLLRISHYAIIDEVELELKAGFSVMTGETGAGKSILVDALGLALGDRADARAVQDGAKRAEISAVFDIGRDHPAFEWLCERGLDDEELCCLRRTISAEGRSRAFVNNRPVTLQDLKSVGGLLVDIHGQHAHQSLLSTPVQRRLLDAYGELDEAARAVANAYSAWQAAERELDERSDQRTDRAAQRELLQFQLGELEALALEPGEPAELRTESQRLRNVDRLQQATAEAAEALYEAETGSAHALAARARRALESIRAHEPALAGCIDRLGSAEIELREVAIEIRHYLDALEADPARLDEVETRLQRIQSLARRHRVDEDELSNVAANL
ncbi:MAG: AAA family ATPase, partial [Gammaproteobacteria bacterium]|nr:AAA family ATPase [Gammaproteobacteria bacterium]